MLVLRSEIPTCLYTNSESRHTFLRPRELCSLPGRDLAAYRSALALRLQAPREPRVRCDDLPELCPQRRARFGPRSHFSVLMFSPHH